MTIEITDTEFNTLIGCLTDRINGEISYYHKSAQMKTVARLLKKKLLCEDCEEND